MVRNMPLPATRAPVLLFALLWGQAEHIASQSDQVPVMNNDASRLWWPVWTPVRSGFQSVISAAAGLPCSNFFYVLLLVRCLTQLWDTHQVGWLLLGCGMTCFTRFLNSTW